MKISEEGYEMVYFMFSFFYCNYSQASFFWGGSVIDFRYSPNGEHLVSSSEDRIIFFFDMFGDQ